MRQREREMVREEGGREGERGIRKVKGKERRTTSGYI